MVNIRNVVELEILNFLTGKPTKKRFVTKDGGTRVAPIDLIEKKNLNFATLEDVPGDDPGDVKRLWQDTWMSKLRGMHWKLLKACIRSR